MSRSLLSKSIFTSALLSSLCVCTFSYADFFLSHEKKEQKNPEPMPWFTGPLLAPSGHVIPKGNVNIEPYLFYTVYSGVYSNHWNPNSTPNFYNTVLQVPVQIGIVKSMDFQFAPQLVWNRTQGENYVDIGDIPFAFDFQLFMDSVGAWNPAAKLTLRANLPVGKYEHLHSRKLGTDAVGSGSWLPAVGLVFSKLFHFGEGIHFLGTRLAFGYSIGTVAYVEGLNSYGGDKGTKGRVYPGNTFAVDGSIELSLSQRWVFAMDGVYSHYNKTRFSGKTTAPVGSPYNKTRFSGKTTAPVGSPSGEQFSLAPALEYNFNINVGLIGGVWFTVAGRNTSRFTSGVLALNIYI